LVVVDSPSADRWSPILVRAVLSLKNPGDFHALDANEQTKAEAIPFFGAAIAGQVHLAGLQQNLQEHRTEAIFFTRFSNLPLPPESLER